MRGSENRLMLVLATVRQPAEDRAFRQRLVRAACLRPRTHVQAYIQFFLLAVLRRRVACSA